jgi:hypothetical protein
MMTTGGNLVMPWRLDMHCIWMALLALTISALTAGCRTAQSLPPSWTHTVRLIATIPALPLPDNPIESERTTTLAPVLSPYQWSTRRVVRYSGRSAVVPVRPDVHIGFGLVPLDLAAPNAVAPDILTPLVLSLLVHNRSQNGIAIDWNDVRLMGTEQIAHRVIHRDANSSDRRVTTVPPGGRAEDFVYPRELSSWTYFEDIKPGQRFALKLPLSYGGRQTDYQFLFEVMPPRQQAS